MEKSLKQQLKIKQKQQVITIEFCEIFKPFFNSKFFFFQLSKIKSTISLHQGQVAGQRRFIDQGRFGQVEKVHVRQQVCKVAAHRHPQHEE